MRLVLVMAVGVFMAVSASAQEETLLDTEIESGGFGAPVVKLTQINDEVGILAGVRGGWIINRRLSIGAGGYGLANSIDAGVTTPDTLELEFGYGGLELEFIGFSDRLFHYTFTALIGGGSVSFRDTEGNESDIKSDAFFVAEPTANVVLNVTSFFRIALGAGYRLVWDVDTPGLTQEELGGPTATLTFKFGQF